MVRCNKPAWHWHHTSELLTHCLMTHSLCGESPGWIIGCLYRNWVWYNSNNSNSHDSVYGARVHPVHLMNVARSARWSPTFGPSRSAWANRSTGSYSDYIHHRHLLLTTQPKSWYSVYRPTEGRRLSWRSWLASYRDGELLGVWYLLRPTRIQLNFGLSMYSGPLSLSGNFGLRPKFQLREITSVFGLTLYLSRTFARRKAESETEVVDCLHWLCFVGKRKAAERHSEFSDWSTVWSHQTRPGK